MGASALAASLAAALPLTSLHAALLLRNLGTSAPVIGFGLGLSGFLGFLGFVRVLRVFRSRVGPRGLGVWVWVFGLSI